MEHRELFIQATLAICGNLRIEQALCACVKVLSDHVPVERMFLQVFEPSLGVVRTIATATADEGQEVDLLTPIPKEVRDLSAQYADRIQVGGVHISDPERNPIAREMLRFHGVEGWSVLHMVLSLSDGNIGSLVLGAPGPDRYGEEHRELIGMLKEPFTIALYNALEHREVLRLRDRLADDNRYLSRELQRLSGDEIIGADFGLKGVMQLVRKVAPTDSPVLLSGETGVGKDVVANALHQASARRDGPFIAVNCGAIPETLLDSELFGHEKGAFTGALSRKRGRFERAHGGTIFLDEIGEMSLDAQVRLLRVLQNREFERIGGTEPLRADIRVIAATNKDLKARIESGDFREDLWFRLNVFPIVIPPLRERTSDIPALVQHFLERKARELKLEDTPALADGAIDELQAYHWPGNVRELENLVERAMIIHQGEPLSFDLGVSVGGHAPRPAPDDDDAELLGLDEVVARQIQRALHRAGGKIHGPDGAAALLGINPSTLRHRMKKLGVSKSSE